MRERCSVAEAGFGNETQQQTIAARAINRREVAAGSRPLVKDRTFGIMNLELTDEEGAALANELDGIVRNDRYPFSPRIQTLRAILAKLRPEPVREPRPEPKRCEPP